MQGEHLMGVDFGCTTHVKIQSLTIWDFRRHQVWHEDPAMEGEQEDGESAAATWARTVPFIQALIYPALPSEPRSPQGCRVRTGKCNAACWRLPAGQPQRKTSGIPGKHSKAPTWLE